MIFSLGFVTTVSLSTSVAYLKEKSMSECVGYMSRRSFPVFGLCLALALCYSGQLLGRVMTSVTSLNCLEQYDTKLDDIVYDPESPFQLFFPSVFYPFQVRTWRAVFSLHLPSRSECILTLLCLCLVDSYCVDYSARIHQPH
jgi:hypothetical protein